MVSEGIFIELNFDRQKLILRVPENKSQDFQAREVIQEIPLNDLIHLSVLTVRDRYIRSFAANPEHNFGIRKTAKAI